MIQLLRQLHNGQIGEVYKVFVLVSRCVCVLYGAIISTLLSVFIVYGGMNKWFWFKFGVGICALIVGALPVTKPEQENDRSKVIFVISLIGLGFQTTDIVHHYRYLNIRGSYYPWPIELPVTVALVFMILHGLSTIPDRTQIVN